jgi:hypothetical protein
MTTDEALNNAAQLIVHKKLKPKVTETLRTLARSVLKQRIEIEEIKKTIDLHDAILERMRVQGQVTYPTYLTIKAKEQLQ